MTRARTAVIASAVAMILALAAAPAAAQPMVDPREMSGQARPDTDVPVGTMTVRVVAGELARNAPAGQMVYLTRLRADGTIDVVAQPTDQNGRATFPGLDTTGAVSYYAFTLFGQDRLESEVVTLDKMAGIRMMLAGRKVGPDGQPIGEAIDDAREDDQPVVPAGEVVVLVQGVGVTAGQDVELLQLPTADGAALRSVARVAAQKAGSDDRGLVARFTDVPFIADGVFVTRVAVQGKTFLSRPFMLRGDVGVARQILVIDRLIVSAHLACELDDEKLRCQVQFVVQNVGGGPVDMGEAGLLLPLPPTAMGPALEEEHPNRGIDGDMNVRIRGALPPGSSKIIAQFSLPVEDGHVAATMAAPLGLFQSTFVVERLPGATFTPPVGTQAMERETDDGRPFWVVPQLSLPAGASLSFALDGLPRRPASDRQARVVVTVVAILLLGGAVLLTFVLHRRRPKTRVVAGDPVARRKTLVGERERLYEALVQVEKERAQDRDGERAAVLAKKRAELIVQLTATLRELDDLDARSAAS